MHVDSFNGQGGNFDLGLRLGSMLHLCPTVESHAPVRTTRAHVTHYSLTCTLVEPLSKAAQPFSSKPPTSEPQPPAPGSGWAAGFQHVGVNDGKVRVAGVYLWKSLSLSLSLPLPLCVSIHIYIYIYMYTYTCLYICIYIYLCACT